MELRQDDIIHVIHATNEELHVLIDKIHKKLYEISN